MRAEILTLSPVTVNPYCSGFSGIHCCYWQLKHSSFLPRMVSCPRSYHQRKRDRGSGRSASHYPAPPLPSSPPP
ncbi:hypothetical protein UPYG_G00078340 [Umbra pygmaea]|uniref:Uncharacterized protein n=1 Tax=Umbra pygmaea TaxID=75934 RepID=A0ABD0XD82_UMBPY